MIAWQSDKDREGQADEIALYDGENANVTIDFAGRSEQSLPSTTERAWKAEKWNTLVLPFDISVAELSEKLGYAIVNVIDDVDLTGDKPVFKFKLTMSLY